MALSVEFPHRTEEPGAFTLPGRMLSIAAGIPRARRAAGPCSDANPHPSPLAGPLSNSRHATHGRAGMEVGLADLGPRQQATFGPFGRKFGQYDRPSAGAGSHAGGSTLARDARVPRHQAGERLPGMPQEVYISHTRCASVSSTGPVRLQLMRGRTAPKATRRPWTGPGAGAGSFT
jgi:hypothetical protein